MKFQLKVLAVALALSATVLPAQAAITNATTSGDSSMVLTLVDFADGISSVYNLGYTYSQFDAMVSNAAANGGALTWDISALYGSTWNTFWATAQAGTTSWAVYAADNTGNGVGSRGMIMTKGDVMPTSITNLQLTTQLTNGIAGMETYLTPNGTADSAFATSGAAYAGSANAYGSTGKIKGQGYDSSNPLDTSMQILQLLSGATATAPITTTVLGSTEGTYSFSMSSAGVLSFNVPVTSAVPEADNYAMLLAGLGVVAALARRRKA